MSSGPSKTSRLVLASGSSYRQQLLGKLGLDFLAEAPAIDEAPRPGETPEALALRLSQEKAEALASSYPDHLIIGSDQVAVIGGQRLGKPGDRNTAIRQLQLASGRSVSFHTGICVLDSRSGEHHCQLDRTIVLFRALSPAQIERYVDHEQPFDCAGSFKSEGLGIALFEKIDGEDPNALIGLPLIRLVSILAGFGIELP